MDFAPIRVGVDAIVEPSGKSNRDTCDIYIYIYIYIYTHVICGDARFSLKMVLAACLPKTYRDQYGLQSKALTGGEG